MLTERLGETDPEELLRLALARPAEAIGRARELTATSKDPTALSFAQQAIGIVLRDRGDMSAAVRELRSAIRLAGTSGSADRVADVRATLGAALVMDGKTHAGLGQLDLAAGEARGQVLAKVLMRRAYVLAMVGRHQPALEDMRRALAGIRRAHDPVWEARALNNRGNIQIALGAVSRAERDVLQAETLFRSAGQDLEAVHTQHNRGVIAYCKGDLPTALSLYDEAGSRYAELGVESSDLAVDRCVAYLAAGLPGDARAAASTALREYSLQPRARAELTLMLANAALADGDPRAALTSASEARRLFHRQRRDWWEVRADLVIGRARFASGDGGRRMLQTAVAVGRRLEELRADEAPLGWLLAGRLAAQLELDSCHTYFRAAARYRAGGSGLVRATGWLARALDCRLSGSSRGVYAACGRGLDELHEHQMTLGSSELRALATLHGRELATIALRQALDSGGARNLLRWSERWRATALTLPPVRPPSDPTVAATLAALRDNQRRLHDARARQAPTYALEKETTRLEQSIRRERLRLAGERTQLRALDLDRLVDELGETTLVEIVEVDDSLHALVVRRGRVRRFSVGPVGDAVHALDFARFALRQAARGRPTELKAVAQRLQSVLLGEAAVGLGEDAVVVAPPSRFHATPWPLLPRLACRPVSTVPSAALWLRARAAPRPTRSRAVLIAGPDLSTGGAEVSTLGARYSDAVVLRDGSATVERSLSALDGAMLGHIAAHGRFRADNPMFSSLMLDDGPMTVHDFERLEKAPYRLILSACDSGVMSPVGSDELLGLASALLSLGTAGIVSSVAVVNDQATVPLMVALHRDLQAGYDLAESLFQMRQAARGDPLAEATSASFVALGV